MTGLSQSSPDLQMKCSEGVIEGRKLQTWDLSGLKLLVPVDFPSTLTGFLVRQVAKDFKSNPPRNRALRASCDFGAHPPNRAIAILLRPQNKTIHGVSAIVVGLLAAGVVRRDRISRTFFRVEVLCFSLQIFVFWTNVIRIATMSVSHVTSFLWATCHMFF